MMIERIFKELDLLVLSNFGDLQASLETEQGKALIEQLSSKENASELQTWYESSTSMNSLASEVKAILEREQSEPDERRVK